MDDKTKLYVFERKEVVLILLFMILSAITAFTIGVRVGKNFSYDTAGVTHEDRSKVELLSGQEEQVQKLVDDFKEEPIPPAKDVINESQKRLSKEVQKIEDGAMDKEIAKEKADIIDQKMKQDQVKAEEEKPAEVVDPFSQNEEMSQSTSKDHLSGKYTIQVGSYRSVKDAETFADGFRVRGYNPIISEVDIKGRGTWFRVSLGVFETIAEAKKYVDKERTLFMGQKYRFYKFQ